MKMNDINSYSDLELALMVLLNYLGTGATRKQKLGTRYLPVQTLVNEILASNSIPKGTSKLTIEDLYLALLNMEPTHEDYIEYINDIIDKVKEGTK